ncbi:MAG TPA: hypothetical protein VGE04_18200 [Chloroflexia bacterium]|jgi:hypothetical protein
MTNQIRRQGAGPTATATAATSAVAQATTSQPLQQALRVYCDDAAALRLSDGTPLYLEWVILATDGTLNRVPAEAGGWLRRSRYEGCLDVLTPVSAQKAEYVIWLTYADTDGLAAEGYSGAHQSF